MCTPRRTCRSAWTMLLHRTDGNGSMHGGNMRAALHGHRTQKRQRGGEEVTAPAAFRPRQKKKKKKKTRHRQRGGGGAGAAARLRVWCVFVNEQTRTSPLAGRRWCYAATGMLQRTRTHTHIERQCTVFARTWSGGTRGAFSRVIRESVQSGCLDAALARANGDGGAPIGREIDGSLCLLPSFRFASSGAALDHGNDRSH